MTQTEAILRLFKTNASGLAKMLGHKHETKVRYWVTVGKIPVWRHSAIFDAAKKQKIQRESVERALGAASK